MAVEREKKIEEQMLFDNAPVESNDYETEAQILDAQVKKQGVTNIGVVASYGAGKSSAITTYLKRYRSNCVFGPKHVQVSLADFNKDENEMPSETNNYSENAIERSILQQLLYSQKKHKLPKSSINRTNKSSILLTIGLALLSVVFILSIITLFFELSGNSLFAKFIDNAALIETIASCTLTVSLVILVICLARFGLLKKVKYKDFEIAIDEKGEVPKDYSLFNNFVNEVLYFFECVNVDLVIFEDLDRLENLKIFVKLRELNTIINNSPKKAKKVTFIYAVKDSMFKDEKQRAKFFEFILPVIPVMNPVTTYDNIMEMHKIQTAKDTSLKLSEQFLKDISFYVSDMRVLKNTFNDYVIMANKLSENSDKKLPVKKENLFALVLYKNLYPYDYSRLQQNEGLIPLCIDKEKLVRIFKKAEEERINELEAEKKRIEEEFLRDFKELKFIFKGQHYRNSHLNCNSMVKNVDDIDTFKDVNFLRHPIHESYAVQLQNLPNGETYYEREKIIKGETDEGITRIDNEIRECKSKIEEIETKSFYSLLSDFGIEKYFSEDNLLKIKEEYTELAANEYFNGQIKENLPSDKQDLRFNTQLNFLRMLINKNYIDENYLEYTSNNKSNLSLNDREFIRNVKQGYVKTYNYKLDNVKAVIANLNEEDFLQPAILIKDICLSLSDIQEIDTKNVIKTNKFNNLMRLLATGSKLVLNAVGEFISVSTNDEKFTFADYIAQFAPELIEPLFLKNLSQSDKDIFITAAIVYGRFEILNSKVLKSFIESHPHYLNLFEDLEIGEIVKVIKTLNLHFNFIDLSNGKDEIYECVVNGDNYNLTVDNLKIILNIDESNNVDFEQKNYSFIQNSGNARLISKVNDSLSIYLNDVYIKLTNSNESEKIFKSFILDENLDNELKSKLIHHSKIKIATLKDVDEQFYELILIENKCIASWENIFTVYKTGKYNDTLFEFISLNNGIVTGSFANQDKSLHIELFNYLINSKFNDEVFANLAKSIDLNLPMNSGYAKNENCKQFVLNGRFAYNVADMSILSNTYNMFHYLNCHQSKILSEMKQFFMGHTFAASFMDAILDDDKLTIDFKKEFVYICGTSLVNIEGIEEKLAGFINENNCKITEGLLYKFTGAEIDKSLKIGLLSIAVKQNIITNLSNFKSYFTSISNEYAELWGATQKTTLEDNNNTRAVINYMKEKNMVTYTSRKGKLYLRRA